MVLLRPPYAGAKYTTSFSDNFKSRISTQLFGNEAPTGTISDKSYYVSDHRDSKRAESSAAEHIIVTVRAAVLAAHQLIGSPHRPRGAGMEAS
jgi:hypothetical protein